MSTFEVTGAVRADVDCPAGDVRVTTTDEPRAEVEVTPLRDDEVTREAVANTVVELRGHDLVVEVPRRDGSFFGREPRIRVAVRVPHGSDLVFRTASAGVTATGRFGAVEGRTASGDVRVTEARELRVETASGDVDVTEVHGSAGLKTASGGLALAHAAGPVEASVVSGDLRVRAADRGGEFSAVSGAIEVGAVAEGEVDVRSVSGDVTLGVVPGSRLRVDVTTVTGDLRSEVELADAPGAAGDGPLVTVRGRTVSGDLRIRRSVPVG